MTNHLIDLNTLWIGNDPGALEILCMMSAAAHGHRIRLFSYQQFGGLPECIERSDAREILPEEAIIRHRLTGSPSLFSNRFRYELIRRGYGAWTDADMLFLKPVAYGNGNIFASFQPDTDEIASNFLAYDPKSPLAEELCHWSAQREMIPPWLSRTDRAWFRARKVFGLRPMVEDLPWGVLGPHLLTYGLRKHGMMGEASPWQRFNPVPHARKELPFLAAGHAESYITPVTEAIHLWHQGLSGGMTGDNAFANRTVPFEEGSLVWNVAKELGLTTSKAWKV